MGTLSKLRRAYKLRAWFAEWRERARVGAQVEDLPDDGNEVAGRRRDGPAALPQAAG